MGISSELLQILRCPDCSSLFACGEGELICGNCGAVIPVIDDIPRFYGLTEKNIIEFDERTIRTPAKWTGWRTRNYEFFLEHMADADKSSSVLDIGAGTAPFEIFLKQFNTVKIDFEPYRGIDFLTDINKTLPLVEKKFDMIIMSNLLEHIYDPVSLLNECYRVLKRGGKLIMTVPFFIKIHQSPHDYFRYTEYMLGRMLALAGFQEFNIVKIGNVFDVHRQIVKSMYDFIYGKTSSSLLKRNCITLLYRLHNLCFNGITRIFVPEGINAEDSIGYPQGYGLSATRIE